MLQHHNTNPQSPERVVILGANGFVGNATKEHLQAKQINVLPITRQQIDLKSDQAAQQLTDLLQPNDALVIAAAEAPVKNITMLINNFQMMQAICTALEARPVNHIIYISSDAVYADSDQPLTEASAAEPASLHGMMHITREMMLNTIRGNTPLACLRPTLIYGDKDPHNGYGPNQFRRLASEGQTITLFGEGEEQRDHVFIDDVAHIIEQTLQHRSKGVLNIATGQVTSFRDIAEQINALYNNPAPIQTRPRQGPMPHNGLRPFDLRACRQAFPEIKPVKVFEGIEVILQAMPIEH
jgi:UDP-glucose 4-epimerase